MSKPRISYVDPATVTDPAMHRRIRTLRARGHAAAGKPGDPRACAGDVLVLRQHLARRVPERRRRPHDQGAVPRLCLALRAVRVLRQPALDQGGQVRPEGGRLHGPDQFRELDALRRAAEGGARLRRGDHLGPAGGRRAVGAPAQAFQRAGAGRDRLLRRHHHGPAALAAHAQHRAPPDSGRHRRLDGARLRDRRGAQAFKQAADYWAKINPKPASQAAE